MLLFAAALLLGTASANNATVELLHTAVDPVNLDYPVESRIYEEDPSLIVVTHRASGGITVFNHSANALAPPLVAAWRGPPVEGQDRRGDTLVVAALGNRASNGSKLLLFNMSAKAGPRGLLGGGGPVATLPLSFDGALHVKIYAPSAGSGAEGDAGGRAGTLFAIITSGLTSAGGADRTRVSAVDISDAQRPVEVAHTSTPCACTEGIMIVGDVAFVGSYCDNTVVTISLRGLVDRSLPARMSLLQSRTQPWYQNMVSAVAGGSYSYPTASHERAQLAQPTSPPHPPLLYAASYACPGGLVIFDSAAMAANGTISEVGRIISLPSSRANRVHMSRDGRFALLALEKSPDMPNGTAPETGGLAVVDVQDPTSPAVLAIERVPDVSSRAYCAATRDAGNGSGSGGLYVYVFAATAQAMYTYLVSWS